MTESEKIAGAKPSPSQLAYLRSAEKNLLHFEPSHLGLGRWRDYCAQREGRYNPSIRGGSRLVAAGWIRLVPYDSYRERDGVRYYFQRAELTELGRSFLEAASPATRPLKQLPPSYRSA